MEAGTAATSLRHCTAPYGTVVRSRVYERAASARWCWSAMGARGGRGRGREISLRARVHGSRENREPTATAETAEEGTGRRQERTPRDNPLKPPCVSNVIIFFRKFGSLKYLYIFWIFSRSWGKIW